MKRMRKCCCEKCQHGEEMIVAISNESGTWNLTPYQAKKFKKYKGMYWDVTQGTGILLRGKVDQNGTLTDLPNAVGIPAGPTARLRIRCYGICGDPGYYGEVIATNAGIDGTWDLTPYKNEKYPQARYGRWEIRGYPGNGAIMSGSISDNGELEFFPDNLFPLIRHDDPLKAVMLCDLIIRCSSANFCNVPHSVVHLEEPLVIYEGLREGIGDFDTMTGVAPPGTVWILEMYGAKPGGAFGALPFEPKTFMFGDCGCDSYVGINDYYGYVDSIGRLVSNRTTFQNMASQCAKWRGKILVGNNAMISSNQMVENQRCLTPFIRWNEVFKPMSTALFPLSSTAIPEGRIVDASSIVSFVSANALEGTPFKVDCLTHGIEDYKYERIRANTSRHVTNNDGETCVEAGIEMGTGRCWQNNYHFLCGIIPETFIARGNPDTLSEELVLRVHYISK